MNSIEKKIDSIVRSGSLVQPLLLEKVKERVQANPLTNEERKPAQKRRKVIVAVKAAASACAVFILCFFTFFLCLPMFMPANSAPPSGDSDGTPSPGSAYAYEDLIKYPLIGNGYILLFGNERLAPRVSRSPRRICRVVFQKQLYSLQNRIQYRRLKSNRDTDCFRLHDRTASQRQRIGKVFLLRNRKHISKKRFIRRISRIPVHSRSRRLENIRNDNGSRRRASRNDNASAFFEP